MILPLQGSMDLLSSGGKAPWTPKSPGGLVLWLAASAITGLNDGDALTTWNDLSGNGNNLTQSDSTKRPLYKTNIVNGQPSVRFDGTNDHLYSSATFDISNGFTLFAVSKNRVRKNYQGYCRIAAVVGGSSTYLTWFWRAGGSDSSSGESEIWVNELSGSLTKVSTSATPPAVNTWGLHGVKDPAGAINQYHNGTVLTNNTSSGPQNLPSGAQLFWLGVGIAGHYLDGDIAELLFYTPELSSTDQGLVEAYLMPNYGLS